MNLNEQSKKIKSIYQVFSDYSKDQVDEMINELDNNDKNLLKLKYGDDLDNPINNPSLEINIEFFNILFPKMEKLLSSKGQLQTKKPAIYQDFSQYSKEKIDKVISELDDYDKSLLRIKYGINLDRPFSNNFVDKNKKFEFDNYLLPKIQFMLEDGKEVPKVEKIVTEPSFASSKTTIRIKSIYQFFQEYSRESIDEMIRNLPDEDKELLKIRYGDDFNNPVASPLFNKEKKDAFYNVLVPKMKKYLKDHDFGQKQQTIYDLLEEYNPKQIDEAISKLNVNDKQLLDLKYGHDLNNPITNPLFDKEKDILFHNVLIPKIKRYLDTPNLNFVNKIDDLQKPSDITKKVHNIKTKTMASDEKSKAKKTNIVTNKSPNHKIRQSKRRTKITKQNYIEVKELLEQPSFTYLVNTLGEKDALIIAFRLLYHFSADDIAKYLDIPSLEVTKATARFLICYKTQMQNCMDEASNFVMKKGSI